ncbi:YbaN family protein [Engelhardtia mirabilis]|uniref:Inner membrane protein YbaN n=1 Tax=Engelhardtia mirabilis TaxID=2528011 RepID=A0A518BKK8_9BACT|nr:Inner membrane protein YbaN [Planctomycetes bacterium Pla133]QDV01837.1 Inner membrane protein YbaN [Planctomycetes bacterium Pla86]
MFHARTIGFDLRRLTRPLMAALGLTFAAIGAVGVVVPLLPTTPFLLLAAWCFSNSSPRLHNWLLASPVLGQLLADWGAYGAIRLRAKWVSTAVLLGFIAWPIAGGRVPLNLLPFVGLTVAAVLTFIWTRPSGPPAVSRDPSGQPEDLPSGR